MLTASIFNANRVLDVACGTGNITIPIARAGAQVTGFDIAPNWLEQAQGGRGTEGLTVTFDERQRRAMHYADASFDLVVSMFGAMFVPTRNTSAAEMLRVCRSGGRIAMATGTPDGFVGQMFRPSASMSHPHPVCLPPCCGAIEAIVTERLGGATAAAQCTQRTICL